MKSLKHTNLFTTIISILILISLILFWGCQKDDFYSNKFHDSDFLHLTVEKDFFSMSYTDMKILSEALSRIDVYKKNGFYKLKQKSGSQINISEDLFEYIKNLYDNTNASFRSQTASLSIPRLKNGDPEDQDSYSSSDCMAHSISYAGGGNYGDVGSYLISQYGLGVPASEFYNACNHFFPSGDTVNVSSISHGQMDSQIIIFQSGPNTGHAVNGLWYDQNNGSMMYWDEQNSQSGILHTSDIMYIYQH